MLNNDAFPEIQGLGNCAQNCDLHCLFTVHEIAEKILATLHVNDGAIKHQIYKENEIIYQQNSTSNYIIMVHSGLIKLVDFSTEGKQHIFFLAGPRHVIGLSALISENMRHNAIALQTTRVCKIPVSLLKKLYTEYPDLYRCLMQLWQLNLDLTDRYISGFSTGLVTMRLANLILFLIDINVVLRKSNRVKLLNLSDMAAILGVTPETVCRELSKLKQAKVLKKLNGQEYFCNYQGIKSIINLPGI
ncbi:MAG: Crp/Fnr family transcriptional regulator [Methylovulum sp.]